MATELIETQEFDKIIYQIFLLDNNYTVYARQKESEEKFSAVASFETLEEARAYIIEENKISS